MNEQTNQNKPARVETQWEAPEFPKQAGGSPPAKEWVERSVWTERMLKRLEESQEQTVWFSLWDKVWQTANLDQAILKVILNHGGAGVDGETTEQLKLNWEPKRDQLQKELKTGTYQPQPSLRRWIPKLGSKELRPLAVPVVRDRAVQTALRNVIEPIFERDFAEQSYGFRPNRGCMDALSRVESLLNAGNTWVVDADLKSYFDTIPHSRLMKLVSKRIADGKVLELIEKYLKAGVMETKTEWQPGIKGTPQGSVISPLLANIYLNPLDHKMKEKGYEMVRYADDFVVCVQTEEEARKALEEITAWVKEAGLTLHPEKTRIVNASEKGGFDFLGYHFEQYRGGKGKKWPRKKSLKKLRDRMREKLPRGRSGSIKSILSEIKPMLKGWHGYFKYCSIGAMKDVDQWVRERIRHIIRRRKKRRGMVMGRERTEYPNHWFEEQGYYSLEKAQAKWLQS